MSCMRSLRSRAVSVVFRYRHGECRDVLSAKDVVKGPPPETRILWSCGSLGEGVITPVLSNCSEKFRKIPLQEKS